jgi:hypothetical protein
MAKKSAEYAEDLLGKSTLKSFFGVTGNDGNLVHTYGTEQLPDNWYKRASGDEYTIP